MVAILQEVGFPHTGSLFYGKLGNLTVTVLRRYYFDLEFCKFGSAWAFITFLSKTSWLELVLLGRFFSEASILFGLN